MTRKFIVIISLYIFVIANSQQNKYIIVQDSTVNWNMHFQYTNIWQAHPSFYAAYSGKNSLNSIDEEDMSMTSTMFLGVKLWQGANLYFNPEIGGGKGFSSTTGIAGFSNGEIYRVANPTPSPYIARIYIKETFNLSSNNFVNVDEGANALMEKNAYPRINFLIGKFSVTDIIDNNTYSHDTRSQFMNWSLMYNGAWDYAANTRGYTWGGSAELIFNPKWSFRFATTSVPKVANGPDLEYSLWNGKKAASFMFEIERDYQIDSKNGAIRLLLYNNLTRAGNYRTAINNFNNGTDKSLNVDSLTTYKGGKTGFGLNAEQQLSNDIGIFSRVGWNDGRYASWAFTEIDQTFSLGINFNGNIWNRKHDVLGVAYVINGISKDHRDFLNTGGYGFIIGDGKLTHYGEEQITEAYYNIQIYNFMILAGGYQFILNPAYNKDRGPVNVFSVRLHVEF